MKTAWHWITRPWLSRWWWDYLLAGRTGRRWPGWRRFACRANGHPGGPVFYNVGGTEPDWRCQTCGEYLG